MSSTSSRIYFVIESSILTIKNHCRHRDFKWALVSGTLIGFCYPPFQPWTLLVCLVPLWITWWKNPSIGFTFFTGFVAQFILSLIGFNWVIHVAKEFGHMPLPIAALALLGYCLIGSLHIPLAGATIQLFRRYFKFSYPLFFLTLPILTASWEWFYPQIFPWNFGYPILWGDFSSAQLASFVGFNGLSLLVQICNGLICIALVAQGKVKKAYPLVFLGVLITAAQFLGFQTLKQIPEPDKKIKVHLIQPNIGNFDKFYAELGGRYQEPVVNKTLEVTRQSLLSSSSDGELVVWPETAYPQQLDSWASTQKYYGILTDFVRNSRKHFIIGAYSDDPPGSKTIRTYNAIFHIAPEGNIKSMYRKNVLLAFGEYIPGSKWFPFLKSWIPEAGDFSQGEGPGLISLGEVNLGPLICYEILDTQHVGNTIALGSQILINLTNDSWFGEKFEPYQHLIMAAGRTIEYRRPLIRVTNTGISALVSEKGKIIAQGPQNVEWSLAMELPYNSVPTTTLFFKLYPFLSWIFFGLSAIALICAKLFSKHSRS